MPAPSSRAPRRTWLLPLMVVAGAAALLGVILALNQNGQTATEGEALPEGELVTPSPAPPAEVEDPSAPDLSDVERRDADDLLAAGPVDAPVALVIFSDYQCPFCATWSSETLPLMMEHADAGDLRIEWRDVNVFGPASERASRASYAAAEQGAFWEYHDALFAGGEARSEGELDEPALTDLAAELGLDLEQFEEDLHSAATAEQIGANQQLGLDLGAYSTPAFVLGGQPIVGAQPTEVFLDAFDAAMTAAG